MTHREITHISGVIRMIAGAAGRRAMEFIREGHNDTSGCVTLELALIAGATGLLSRALAMGMGDLVVEPLETAHSALCQSISFVCVRPT